MSAELWRLTMEDGRRIDVLTVNCPTAVDCSAQLYKHVPKDTTIKTRELLSTFTYAPFSCIVSERDVARLAGW